MRRTLILAVGCGLFASVAFAQTPPAGVPSAQDFVNKVAGSDMFDIQASSARAVEAGRCRYQAVR